MSTTGTDNFRIVEMLKAGGALFAVDATSQIVVEGISVRTLEVHLQPDAEDVPVQLNLPSGVSDLLYLRLQSDAAFEMELDDGLGNSVVLVVKGLFSGVFQPGSGPSALSLGNPSGVTRATVRVVYAHLTAAGDEPSFFA